VVYARYGSPNVLSIEDVPVPTPRPKQILVAVAATSVNRSDWEALTGSPAYARLGGLSSPARRVIGSDIAERVAPRGHYLCVGGTAWELLRVATVGAGLGLVTGRRLGLLIAGQRPARFKPVADRCISGKVEIHVDWTYRSDETPRALAHLGEGRALGKVVMTP
jgi:NADPH:quinone reductase-like Zn-dependent oxidoreductase